MDNEAIFRTQRTFKALMTAMANPGRRVDLACDVATSILDRVCETLLDHETTFAVVGVDVHDELIDGIRVLTGSRHVSIEQADVVIVAGGASDGAIANARVGDLDCPDRGATLIYPTAGLPASGGCQLRVSGPGIQGEITTPELGVDIADMELLRQLNSQFPLGVDLLCCDADGVLAIPRSSRLTIIPER